MSTKHIETNNYQAGEGRVELKDGVNPFGYLGSSNLLAARLT